jgi:exosome complex RNA-binding protein Csl4
MVTVDFPKESYSPGDIVRAKVLFKRLDGLPLMNSN